MKWGFCGFGNIAKKFCTALLAVEDQKITAVATLSKSHEVSSWLGKCKVYNDYKALADDPEVEIIYINTTHNFHIEQIELFAASGKHILCEKPMFTHPAQIERIKRFEGKVFIMEALWSRFLPAYSKVKEIIHSGLLGQIQWADINFAFDTSDHPKERLQRLELAGGALLDIGIYPIQLVQDLMKNQIPDHITAHATLNDEKVDITTAMILHWKKNDFFAQLFCSVDRLGSNQAVIYGKKGSLTMKNFWMCEEIILETHGKKEYFQYPHSINGYEYQIIEVVECIEGGRFQSEIMSLEDSYNLIQTMGIIKEKVGYGL